LGLGLALGLPKHKEREDGTHKEQKQASNLDTEQGPIQDKEVNQVASFSRQAEAKVKDDLVQEPSFDAVKGHRSKRSPWVAQWPLQGGGGFDRGFDPGFGGGVGGFWPQGPGQLPWGSGRPIHPWQPGPGQLPWGSGRPIHPWQIGQISGANGNAKFQNVLMAAVIPKHWRLANRQDVTDPTGHVKAEARSALTHPNGVYLLLDGTAKGRNFNWVVDGNTNIDHGNAQLVSHKLLIYDPPRFRVIRVSAGIPTNWRMAKEEDLRDSTGQVIGTAKAVMTRECGTYIIQGGRYISHNGLVEPWSPGKCASRGNFKLIVYGCPEYNTNYVGDKHLSYFPQMKTWQECGQKCNEAQNCRGWSWNSANTQMGHIPNMCILKQKESWYTGTRKNENFVISGLKGCPTVGGGAISGPLFGGAINGPDPEGPPPAWDDPFWGEGPTPMGPEGPGLHPGIQWKNGDYAEEPPPSDYAYGSGPEGPPPAWDHPSWGEGPTPIGPERPGLHPALNWKMG